MANNINWGKIYDSTWWGDLTNTINWGIVYRNLIGGQPLTVDTTAYKTDTTLYKTDATKI
jgi:hypothetical protein